MRVAPEHLTALWPIAMAELQRILLNAEATRPALLLAPAYFCLNYTCAAAA